MCGIFAYLNHRVPCERKEIIRKLIEGLKRLEYRGYDSAGLAVDGDEFIGESSTRNIAVIKKRGKVSFLEETANQANLDDTVKVDSHLGIAHTRWATHGPPNEVNCHPQSSDPTNEFVVVHNGIITNCKEIRIFLQKKGYEFVSETDTETIVKLMKYLFDMHEKDNEHVSFLELAEETVSRLEGAYALIFKSIHFPGEMVATRLGSPLLIGIKTDDSAPDLEKIPLLIADSTKTKLAGNVRLDADSSKGLRRTQSYEHFDTHEPVEYFLASDASAVIEHTKRVLFLEDRDVAYVANGNLTIHHFKGHDENEKDLSPIRSVQTLEMELQQIMKGEYSHFMLKEIHEQPESVVNTMRGRVNFEEKKVILGGLVQHISDIQRCRRLLFIACGTSYNSAIATRQFLEEMTELPVIVDIASDFLDRKCPIFRDDVCFFISQSGETADTLSALRYCKSKGALTVGITNTVGSTISRETDCGVHINAGPEIGVASTKAYTSQILTLVMFGLMMSEDRLSKQARRHEVINTLEVLPDLIKSVLDSNDAILKMAERFQDAKSLLIMGRGYSFANCLEGALKVKELTYMHAEGILAGELKHGPLALIEESMPIIMLAMPDDTLKLTQNALEQVVARHGRPMVICAQDYKPNAGGVDLPVLEVPPIVDCLQGVLTVIPLQLLSYHIATKRGYNVDQPRNLAKSVTVE